LKEEKPASLKAEIANSLSHGFGILFAVIASPLLISLATKNNNDSFVFAVAFYSFTMLLVFTTSTLYHAFDNPKVKKTLRMFDHISIFFLIGGSYVPFVVKYTPNNTAVWFLSIQWTLIALGIIKKIFFTGKFRLLSSLIYIFIGSMVVFLGTDFWHSIPQKAIYFIIAGGLSYLIGVIFYQNRKIPYNHFIWHMFVLAAAILHWVGVLVIL
jgi:hemolysin III